MDRLRFLADEHVPSVFVGALRSNGFEVVIGQERYGQGTDDPDILDDCATAGLVVLTNDRDFVGLAEERDHAGVVVYTDQLSLLEDPLASVEAVERLDRYYGQGEIAGVIEWLDGWR
jgi:hypothetical protein